MMLWLHTLTKENVMMRLRPIGLFEEVSYSDLKHVVTALKMTETFNMGKLYEDFCASWGEEDKARQDASDKWMASFQKIRNANLANMFQIVSFVLSVSGSYAFVERIFFSHDQ